MAGAVFISYASQDAEAARRICEALRSGGVEVWFDQEGGLEHGDAWDAKIRSQIRECVLFVPIISANTQARLEGYFRIEWELAAERAMGIAQGVPFILPVAIDDTREPGALIPDRFRKVQWTRMPGGVVSTELRARLLKLWSHRTGAISAAGTPAVAGSSMPFPAEAPGRSRVRFYALIGAVIVVLGAVVGWRFLVGRGTPPAQATSATEPVPPRPLLPRSVAVLAFTSQSTDAQDEYYSEGISEELFNALANIPGLRIAARVSSFYFKGKDVPVADIAKQLGVSYVVQGTVHREGARVRITAQLSSAWDGFQLWSDNIDRDQKDVSDARDEIAGQIAKVLQLRMTGASGTAKAAIDPAAFRLFLEGRARVERASTAELKAGISCFQQAVGLSPKYAAAWARLARANIQLARWGGNETSVGYAQARTAAAKAAALEPDSPDVLVALGWVRRTADWDWKGARQAFRRAIELQPDNPDTLADASVLLFNIGLTDEGVQMATRAAELDPLNAATQPNLSVLLQFAGQMNKAEQAARRAIQLAPEGQRYHGNLAMTLAQLGRPMKAEEEVALEKDDAARHAAIAFIAIFRAQKLRAEAQARQLEAMAQDHPGYADNSLFVAEIYALLGESDRAYAALDKSVAGRDPGCAWYKEDFFLQNLHEDPRWPALLKKTGMSDDQLK